MMLHTLMCNLQPKQTGFNVRESRVWGESLMYLEYLPLSPSTDCYQLFGLLLVALWIFKGPVWPRSASAVGFVTILLFLLPCTVRCVQVKNMATVPQPRPGHERFKPTPLFEPFLMKGAQEWNWLMPNEYHWNAVIVRLMFVTLKLFIKHQFHFRWSHAIKCAPSPLRVPKHEQPKLEQ